MEQTFRFYKTPAKEWYIDLPEWKGDVSELQMVEGADTLLDLVSQNGTECMIEMSDEKLENAELLTLIHVRDKSISNGGDYLLEEYQGKAINHKLWLCGVTEFVFGKLPQKIWFKLER